MKIHLLTDMGKKLLEDLCINLDERFNLKKYSIWHNLLIGASVFFSRKKFSEDNKISNCQIQTTEEIKGQKLCYM